MDNINPLFSLPRREPHAFESIPVLRMKAIAFDLGDTLVEYDGLPLNWEAHYPEALRELANYLEIAVDASLLDAGSAVLRKYNTRLHPREREIAFSTILGELCAAWKIRARPLPEHQATRVFFKTFQQRLRSFPETAAALQSLRREGYRIGIFTDVPYGMPRELVLEDVAQAGLVGLYDVLLTSRDVGYRKPSPPTLTALAVAMDCPPAGLLHVGNEKKDIEVALALGSRAVLINRSEKNPNWGQHRTIRSLRELVDETPAAKERTDH